VDLEGEVSSFEIALEIGKAFGALVALVLWGTTLRAIWRGEAE